MAQTRLKQGNPEAASGNTDNSGSAASPPNYCVESEDKPIGNHNSPPLERGTSVKSTCTSVSVTSYEHDEATLRKSKPFNSRRDDNDSILSKSAAQASCFSSCNSTPPLVWRSPLDVIDRVYGSAYEKKIERARSVLRTSVREVFNILFIGDWLKQFHESSKNKEVTISDWNRGDDGFMRREVHFKKPLTYKIGPKETRVKETQRYSFTSNGGVLLELEGQNFDAPYGDYFVCESYFELTPQGDGSSTLLVASFAVHFSKRTILKKKIESGALAETNVAYQNLVDMASKRIDDHANENKDLAGRKAHVQKRSQDSFVNHAALLTSPAKKQRSWDMNNAAELAVQEQMHNGEKLDQSLKAGSEERSTPQRTSFKSKLSLWK